MIDLIPHEIASSPTFKGLPAFAHVYFKGFIDGPVQYFSAEREGEPFSVVAVNVIRADEKFVWESCADLLTRSVEAATQVVRGVYQFNILNFDVYRELNTFNPQELTHLLLNHSRRLAPGQQRLIKYSSMYGLMQQLADEEWGKVIFKAAVEVFPHPAEKLNLYVRKLCRASEKLPGRRLIVINDMSQTPVYDPADLAQKGRLASEGLSAADLFSNAPEVFMQDKNGRRILASH